MSISYSALPAMCMLVNGPPPTHVSNRHVPGGSFEHSGLATFCLTKFRQNDSMFCRDACPKKWWTTPAPAGVQVRARPLDVHLDLRVYSSEMGHPGTCGWCERRTRDPGRGRDAHCSATGPFACRKRPFSQGGTPSPSCYLAAGVVGPCSCYALQGRRYQKLDIDMIRVAGQHAPGGCHYPVDT
jgi:hypothetical protein